MLPWLTNKKAVTVVRVTAVSARPEAKRNFAVFGLTSTALTSISLTLWFPYQSRGLHVEEKKVSGDNPLSSVLTLGGSILLVFAFSSLLLLAFDTGQGLLGIAVFLVFLTSGGAVILLGSSEKDSVKRDREKVASQGGELAALKARLAQLERKTRELART